MRIDFFEEFPEEEGFKKARLVDFESTVFLAARSLEEFGKWRRDLVRVNPKLEAAYWPILKKSYWISPFSETSELKGLIWDLREHANLGPVKLLLDLEFPILNKVLFVKNLLSFGRNKNLIREILRAARNSGFNVYTARYPGTAYLEGFYEAAGVSYPFSEVLHKKIVMFYTSLIPGELVKSLVGSGISRSVESEGDNIQVGLGTIAKGSLGWEPILSPEALERDLAFVKSCGVKTVTIYRLGGLNKEYLKAISHTRDSV